MEIYYTALITNTAGDRFAGHQLQVAVYAHESNEPAGRALVSYPVQTLAGGADEAGEDDAARTLANHGWALVSAGWDYDRELDESVADVRPTDWQQIVEDATAARDAAERQAKETEAAWRLAIKRAQPADVLGATATAKAANISRERVYQIRDDRR